MRPPTFCIASPDGQHSPDRKSVHREIGVCEFCERDVELTPDGWVLIAEAPVVSSVAQSDGAA